MKLITAEDSIKTGIEDVAENRPRTPTVTQNEKQYLHVSKAARKSEFLIKNILIGRVKLDVTKALVKDSIKKAITATSNKEARSWFIVNYNYIISNKSN